jgi:hypothetical protein
MKGCLMRFPASGIRKIRSQNVAVSRVPHDEGDDIIVDVPAGMDCDVRLEDGVLLIEGTRNDVVGLVLMAQTIDFSGRGMASIVQIQVPRSRTDISSENHHD